VIRVLVRYFQDAALLGQAERLASSRLMTRSMNSTGPMVALFVRFKVITPWQTAFVLVSLFL